MPTQGAVSHNPIARQSGKLRFFSAEAREALTAWTRAKEALRQVMCHEDFMAFVRPMYLIALFSNRCLLLALPPNRRVIERARNFRRNLDVAIERQGYHLAGYTRYPRDEELLTLSSYPSFAPFIEIIARGRARRLRQRIDAENTRDSVDLTRYLRQQSTETLEVAQLVARGFDRPVQQHIAQTIISARSIENRRDRTVLL